MSFQSSFLIGWWSKSQVISRIHSGHIGTTSVFDVEIFYRLIENRSCCFVVLMPSLLYSQWFEEVCWPLLTRREIILKKIDILTGSNIISACLPGWLFTLKCSTMRVHLFHILRPLLRPYRLGYSPNDGYKRTSTLISVCSDKAPISSPCATIENSHAPLAFTIPAAALSCFCLFFPSPFLSILLLFFQYAKYTYEGKEKKTK